ncbi:ABC transporter ATP-binding protein [Micromonospora sp. STR1s_5]|nr:ABC transporter ATP-binding protein [Micromonospora sp. STR1s_5]
MTLPLLSVEGLHVSLRLPLGTLQAVRGISFSIQPGETVCVVGESGCGKSLTALALMGLLPSKAERRAERIIFDGQDLATTSEAAMAEIRGDRMSMIFQEPMTALNPTLTVGRQMTEVLLRHRRVGRAEARERAVYLLDRVGIPRPAERLGQYPHELSGGLRQRVMIATALMCGPKLIVADEPTTALDVTIQAQILRVLMDLKEEFGTALLLITHDLGVVARIADRVLVMYAGAVVEEGEKRPLFRNPLHPYTRGLMACVPVPGKTPRGSTLASIPGMVPSLTADLVGCAFRNRCPHPVTACEHDPLPLARDGDHRALCVLPEGVVEAPASSMTA